MGIILCPRNLNKRVSDWSSKGYLIRLIFYIDKDILTNIIQYSLLISKTIFS